MPPPERGLQQRVAQPQVGRQVEVEVEGLAKQQVEQRESRFVHQVVKLVLVKPVEYLLEVGLMELETCGAAMKTTDTKRNLLARV